jgi:transcriptional regulator with PAS, ATPase and Fis domain
MKDKNPQWMDELPIAITVCDTESKILAMNKKSQKTFEKWGGESLIGESLMPCHPVHAQQKIEELMKNGEVNAYTIEKNGIKKLIYQCPWFENGEQKGLVELSLELPSEMPHFVRK